MGYDEIQQIRDEAGKKKRSTMYAGSSPGMYQFYLAHTLLPITPEALQLKIANNNKTLTLINDGEINILKRPGLTDITFTALLPNVQYPFAQYASGFQPAAYFLEKIEALKTGCAPFRFQVIRTNASGSLALENTSMQVSIEDYQIDEDADKYGLDMSVTIKLKQYRPYATKTITFQQNTETTKATVTTDRSTATAPSAKTYTVKKGDSLWSIAQTQLGSGSRYPEIYNLNKDVIEAAAQKDGQSSSSNGALIYTGTVLQLPS